MSRLGWWALLAPNAVMDPTPSRIILTFDSARVLDHPYRFDAVTIGHVTDTGRLRVRHRGEMVVDIPNAALTDEAPQYQRPLAPAIPPKQNAVLQSEAACFRTEEMNRLGRGP